MAAHTITLDSGALSAIAESAQDIRAGLQKAIAAGANVIAPAIVIAESTTGTARDARVNRILKLITVVALDEQIARDAARLRFARSGAGVADAIVVATADRFPRSVIWTADPDDMRPLTSIKAITAIEVI